MMQHAMLNVLEGPLQGQALAITQHENLVGREPGCEILLEGYTRVSRRHARLHWDGWQFHVTDLGSTNGVLVDGQPIQNSVLRGGSVIQTGDFVAQLWLPPAPPLFLDQPLSPPTVPLSAAPMGSPAPHPQAPPQPAASPFPPQPHLPQPQNAPQGSPMGAPVNASLNAPLVRLGSSMPGTPRQRIVASVAAVGLIAVLMAGGLGGGHGTPGAPSGAADSSNALGDDAGAGSQQASGSEAAGGRISAAAIARGKAATVLIAHAEGKEVSMGSGFVTGDGRHIVTNRHVVVDQSGQPTECLVVFGAGNINTSKIKAEASQISLAPSSGEDGSFAEDLAVITLPERAVEPLAMGSTEGLTETDTVYAVGFPLGTGTLTLDNALPSASVKAVTVERLQKGLVNGAEAVGVLQLGGSITHGNSGGPILNARGEVVGVVSRGPEGTGMSYAIPTVFVKALLQDTLEDTPPAHAEVEAQVLATPDSHTPGETPGETRAEGRDEASGEDRKAPDGETREAPDGETHNAE